MYIERQQSFQEDLNHHKHLPIKGTEYLIMPSNFFMGTFFRNLKLRGGNTWSCRDIQRMLSPASTQLFKCHTYLCKQREGPSTTGYNFLHNYRAKLYRIYTSLVARLPFKSNMDQVSVHTSVCLLHKILCHPFTLPTAWTPDVDSCRTHLGIMSVFAILALARESRRLWKR